MAIHMLQKSGEEQHRPKVGRKSMSLRIDDTKPLSGVFCSNRALCLMNNRHDVDESVLLRKDSTCSTTASSDDSSVHWEKSVTRDSPTTIVTVEHQNPEDARASHVEKARKLSLILQRSKRLPQTPWYYSSDHVLVNRERAKRAVAPLTRMRALDEIARAHAKQMATEGAARHANLDALQIALENIPFQRVGDNSQMGSSIRAIHKKMMTNSSNKNNIVNPSFEHMGMGTAVGENGEIYLCQIFLG